MACGLLAAAAQEAHDVYRPGWAWGLGGYAALLPVAYYRLQWRELRS